MSSYRRSLMGNYATEPIEIIEFEDATVKQLCVSNWGGTIVPGEITTKEAAKVTSLDGVFYQNTTITKFNEFRYFTGVTSLYKGNVNGYAAGQFYGCSALDEITLPENVVDLNGGFRSCSALKTLDLTTIKASGINLTTFLYNSGVRNVTLPGTTYRGTWYYAFRTASNAIREIHVIGTADFSSVDFNPSQAPFGSQKNLSTLTGNWTHIKTTLNLGVCPLTIASAIIILNALDTVTGQTCTFAASKQATFEEDADFLTAKAAAQGRGWTITYA